MSSIAQASADEGLRRESQRDLGVRLQPSQLSGARSGVTSNDGEQAIILGDMTSSIIEPNGALRMTAWDKETVQDVYSPPSNMLHNIQALPMGVDISRP